MHSYRDFDAPFSNGGSPGGGSGGGNQNPKDPLDKPGKDEKID